ncbi:MAG: hypothetical protein ABFD81_12775 [Syntrophaceae bacterium]
MCQDCVDHQMITMETLLSIAMDEERMVAERQRAIDALTLFREHALPVLNHIAKQNTMDILKDRARLYIQRFKSGASMSLSI